MILAITLYTVLHYDSLIPHSQRIVRIASTVRTQLQALPFFRLINSYAVDTLWFLSFTLIFTEILPVQSRLCTVLLLMLLGAASEFSQRAFPHLGTFDVVDLLLYIAIALLSQIPLPCTQA